MLNNTYLIYLSTMYTNYFNNHIIKYQILKIDYVLVVLEQFWVIKMTFVKKKESLEYI